MTPRPRIAVIDYQGGNLQSVVRSFDPVRSDAYITRDPAALREADGLVLPGVGAFADAMRYMDASGQTQAIREATEQGTPLLGICLGMQVLFDRGDEGAAQGSFCEGLGLLRGECTKLSGEVAKIPHVGWNTVELRGSSSPLFAGIPDASSFYFTHSYRVCPADESVVSGITVDRGPLISAVEAAIIPSPGRATVFGVQFHPEKSSMVGLVLMENFAQIVHIAKESQS